MDVKQNRISVVMLPWLAYGHASPFLELAKKLTERNFHVYFCSTPIILNSIKKKLDENKHSPSIQLVEFHLPSSPDLPPHHHTTNGLPSHLMDTLKDALDLAAPNFSSIIETLKPDLVLYDFIQGWAPAIASSLGIPAVQFHISGPTMVSYSLHHIKNPGKPFPFPEIHLRNFNRSVIPNPNEASFDLMKKHVSRFSEALSRSCNIILTRSFREIEGETIDYLSNLSEKKVIPVGPLVEEPVNNDEDDDNNNGIIQWLDKKDESSTVFVSFGSECFLTKDEIEEVAYGLELSEVNFIWAIRFSLGDKIRVEEALPKGFLDRTGERGIMVEGWAPQVKILGHSSIGGFVSHCGWSSLMESMKLGVPIVALPMQLDQPFNARVVEKVGVGVEITRDENGRLQRQKIAEVIRKVVVDKDGEGVRFEARKFSDCIRMKKDKEIDGVVEELLLICNKGK